MTFSGSINLHGYQGVPSNKVKVGTIKRAKGLEFKLVMLPWSTDARSTDDERVARDLRERYVSATRARMRCGSHLSDVTNSPMARDAQQQSEPEAT